MGKFRVFAFFALVWVGGLLLTSSTPVFGQCLTDDQKEKIFQTVENPLSPKENKKVRRELLKMEKERRRLKEKIVKNWDENQKLIEEETQLGREQIQRLCAIFAEYGWLSSENIGADGLRVVLFLVRNSRAIEAQRELFPIIVEAAQKGKISKNNVASLIDMIRVAQNRTQIFGTQTFVRDEIAYLYPLENEQKTDEWRKLYDLIPLRDFVKELEVRYQTPVIKIPRQIVASDRQDQETLLDIGGDQETDEIIRIETKLVNLNVRVLEPEDGAAAAGDLERRDFIVYEDGKEQQIAFFSKTDTPFDLILMLDLSGSTAERRDIIIEATRRFIEAARPADRIAIIAFTHRAEIIADLTGDKKFLFEKVRQIKDEKGGSKIWDALELTYREIIKRPGRDRRSAIILLTDGIDNSLGQIPGRAYPLEAQAPSEITFMELFETVRRGETTIFSICIDAAAWDSWSAKVLRQSRRTLELFAEETGGQYYFARKPKDLRGIYERIINDLSRAYLIGYEPDEANNNVWRKIEVRVKDRPELVVRTKSGYYAK